MTHPSQAVASKARTLSEFARACGGQLRGVDREYAGVSTDTRSLGADELFVALQGPNFNGNEFVGAAEKAGAAGAVISQTVLDRGNAAARGTGAASGVFPQIVVADTQVALEKAARIWREGFSIPVVGVAGSNGKTTVKEMLAAILGHTGHTLATRGNLNNHIGVPLTLFRLDATHRQAVVEMGANHPGELAALVDIARPTIGLITNAGAEHLEGFGTIAGAARAEGEMVAGLAPDATAVINADDEFAGLWRGMTRARIVTFGLRPPADFTAADIRTDIAAEGFVTRYTLRCPLGDAPVSMNLAGRHNVANSLAAAAAAAAAGASLRDIVEGLAGMQAVKGRLQFKKTRQGAWLIDDSYNANPSSVHAGIEVLKGLAGRKWLVFGQMGELGDATEEAHREIGAFARAHGIERLFAVGADARLTVETFGEGAQWFADTAALSQALDRELAAANLRPGVTPRLFDTASGRGEQGATDIRLLVKGSRSNRLERVVEALRGISVDNTSGEAH